MAAIHTLRILCAAFVLAAVGLLFLCWMKIGACQFSFFKMFFCFLANSVFLGGIGAFVFSLSNQPVLGYMASILYFLLNFGSGKKYMGNFFLFSMQYGSFTEKYYLLIGGLVLLLLAVVWRDLIWKRLIWGKHSILWIMVDITMCRRYNRYKYEAFGKCGTSRENVSWKTEWSFKRNRDKFHTQDNTCVVNLQVVRKAWLLWWNGISY